MPKIRRDHKMPFPHVTEHFTPSEIREAVLDNFRSCRSGLPSGPPMRMVPESLCLEIEQLLMFGDLQLTHSETTH